MNATGKRRLLKLADFLQRLPREREFDMSHWADQITNGRPACGTSACAAGWAACIPSFRRAGYRLALRKNGWFDEVMPLPVFGRKKSDAALSAFFDASREDVHAMFGSWHPSSPKKAAQRIRSVVRNASKATTEA